MCSINISKTRLIKITTLLHYHSWPLTNLNCRFIVQTCLPAQVTTSCYSLCRWDKWILIHFVLGFTAEDDEAQMHSSNHAPHFFSNLLISFKTQVAPFRSCWFHFVFSQFFFSPASPLPLSVSVQFPLYVWVVALFPQLSLHQRQRLYSIFFSYHFDCLRQDLLKEKDSKKLA